MVKGIIWRKGIICEILGKGGHREAFLPQIGTECEKRGRQDVSAESRRQREIACAMGALKNPST